jgi:hypothetical protein
MDNVGLSALIFSDILGSSALLVKRWLKSLYLDSYGPHPFSRDCAGQRFETKTFGQNIVTKNDDDPTTDGRNGSLLSWWVPFLDTVRLTVVQHHLLHVDSEPVCRPTEATEIRGVKGHKRTKCERL